MQNHELCRLESYFATFEDRECSRTTNLLELAPLIELYSSIVSLGRYDRAFDILFNRLSPSLMRLGAIQQNVDLFQMLFPHGSERPPSIADRVSRYYAVCSVAHLYSLCGQPGRAVKLYRRLHSPGSKKISRPHGDILLRVCWGIVTSGMSHALRVSGNLHEAEAVVTKGLEFCKNSGNLYWEARHLTCLGAVLITTGRVQEAAEALQRSTDIFGDLRLNDGQSAAHAILSQLMLYLRRPTQAAEMAELACKFAEADRRECDFILLTRIRGHAALALGDLDHALEQLQQALTRARALRVIEEELACLVALAEGRYQEGSINTARELLSDFWEMAERGPYPLFQVDALNLLAKLERTSSNYEAGVLAATKAFDLARGDGPSHAYHWGLETAKENLRKLGAPGHIDNSDPDKSNRKHLSKSTIGPQGKSGGEAH